MIAKKLAPDLRSGVRVSAKPGLRPVFGTLVLVFAATHARPEVIQIKMEHSGAGIAHVGDTVEWVNADFVGHTATSRDGA